ncbi:DNA-directed RNA polymerase subunit H [Candidatus Woesearchaeota archaeon]|nr:DNA-directed RNA polymerase subunit H [Candidatus Woesearchaeota archaeon]
MSKETKHALVPKHSKLSEKQKEELFRKYNISMKELPKIMKNDPAIKHLDPKAGDVIIVVRESGTTGETIFYRGVADAE